MWTLKGHSLNPALSVFKTKIDNSVKGGIA